MIPFETSLNRENFRVDDFKKYLIANGAEILKSQRKDIILSFKYTDKYADQIETIAENLIEGGDFVRTYFVSCLYASFLDNRPFDLRVKIKPVIKKRKRAKRLIRKTSEKRRILLERDGEKCFFCHKKLNKDVTIEHLESLSRGGGNHINNLRLAHEECNSLAGNLPIAEKMKIREKKLITK